MKQTRVKFASEHCTYFDCIVTKSSYGNGRVALCLVDANDDEPVATATINLPDEPMNADEVAIKDYSENAGILVALISAKVITPPHRYVMSGFVKVPICKLLI